MINYELAKKLKDAGYPLKTDTYEAFAHIDGFRYILPTLSELIEACGDKGILMDGNNTEKNHWLVQSQGYQGVGSTPEEAVVNLLLELNKKQHD